jgi:hypothetical protein
MCGEQHDIMKFQITSFFIILLVHYIQVKDRLASKVDPNPNFIYLITKQMDLGVLVYKIYI